jgi:serine/threonine-protein kinase
MGEVHACHDARIGREVAMKRLRSTDAVAIDRFVREARLQRDLEHPAIAPVYDLGTTEDGVPYFTMERVRGVTLAAVVEGLRAGDREVARAHSTRTLLAAFARVCRAVDYAHRRGVLHRDLKPGNVMLGRHGEVRVLDWGCAKSIAEDDAPVIGEFDVGLAVDPTLSQHGEVIGTPGYLAPEQARGQGACARSDSYALGAILFEILTLRPLHASPTALSRLVSTMQGVESRPSARAPELSIATALDELVARALATSPEARPDPREIADEIERILDEEPYLVRRRERITRPRPATPRALASDPLRASTAARMALGALGAFLAVAVGLRDPAAIWPVGALGVALALVPWRSRSWPLERIVR